MGNSITLKISLEYENNAGSAEQAYLAARAGDVVRGTISVEVQKLVKHADAIHLFIIGKEKAAIKSPNGTSYYKSERNLVRSQVVVKQFSEEKIKPGMYNFPFSFVLPSVLPTSMHWSSRKDWCLIKYKLKASLNGTSVETERPFFVAARPLPNSLVPCILDPVTHNIKSIGLTKGSITFGVSVKDTHIGRGENLEICFASRNNSTVNVKEVGIKLVERMIITSRGHTTRDVRTLNKVRFQQLGLEKMPKSEMASNRRAGVDPHEENCREIYNELVSERHKMSFRIPTNARDTYAGNLISVAHHLEITYHTKTMVDNPSARIPLKIGYPPLAEETPAADPSRPIPAQMQVQGGFPVAPGRSSRPIPVPVATGNEIPLVMANPVPASNSHTHINEAPIVEIPSANVIVGGNATNLDDDRNSDDDTGWTGLVPVPPPPTLAALLEEMTASVNDFDIISTRVTDPAWTHVFSPLSPDDFGSIIAHVNVDFDQPRIASYIAPHIRRAFSHEYIIAALKNTAEWNRTTMLQGLLVFWDGLGRESIMAELSTWEQTVSAQDLAAAAQRAGS